MCICIYINKYIIKTIKKYDFGYSTILPTNNVLNPRSIHIWLHSHNNHKYLSITCNQYYRPSSVCILSSNTLNILF